MKPFLQRLALHHVLALSCLLTTAVAQAVTTTEFTAPTGYCFQQTVLRGAPDKTTLEHNLIIATADHFKNGNVFVGFRRRSQPDALWLLNNNLKWSAYDSGNPIDFDPYQLTTTGLQPVMPVPIIPLPLDLTAFSGDGELLVGYGLGTNAADSFQDMVNNQRYSVVWIIGGGDPISKLICLTATEMRVYDPTSSFLASPSSQQ
ncbi:hypothetical protein [Methylobacter sp.]|uniref:hypothetical protein n=1 Tax=Methylobacter sp. TaxID=2051955 RepID=UPI002FDF012E